MFTSMSEFVQKVDQIEADLKAANEKIAALEAKVFPPAAPETEPAPKDEPVPETQS